MSSAAVVVGALRVKYSLMKCHTLFIRKLGEILEIVSSAAVVIGALRVKCSGKSLNTPNAGGSAVAQW